MSSGANSHAGTEQACERKIREVGLGSYHGNLPECEGVWYWHIAEAVAASYEWRPVKGWEDIYEISEHGDVRRITGNHAGHILSQSEGYPSGYPPSPSARKSGGGIPMRSRT
ncbi:MAG: NUMOD4 domain-containing protein [Methyloceanibacter sp.]